MSSYSSAFGTFSLKGTWSASMLSKLNLLKSEWSALHYWTLIEDDFTPSALTLPFTASGRSQYSFTLENLGVAGIDNVEALALLSNEMEANNVYIEIDYVDEERTAEHLCKATAHLRGVAGKLTCEEIAHEEYHYTRANFELLGFEIEDSDWDDDDICPDCGEEWDDCTCEEE